MNIITRLREEETKGIYNVLSPEERVIVHSFWREKYSKLPPADKAVSIYTDDIKIASGYTRLVIGDHGAYLEISRDQMDVKMLEIPKNRRNRKHLLADEKLFILKDEKSLKLCNPFHMKYVWLQPVGRSEKIYLQVGLVKYADYKIGMFYIDPEFVRISHRISL